MNIDLNKYYKRYVLIPAGISVLLNIIYCIFHYNANYKSEFFSQEAAIALTVLMACINGIIILIFSSTIFLNRRMTFVESPFLRFLSWFFIPLFWIVFLLKLFLHASFQPNDDSGDDPIFFIPFFLPNLIGLILGYFFFEREIKTIK